MIVSGCIKSGADYKESEYSDNVQQVYIIFIVSARHCSVLFFQ